MAQQNNRVEIRISAKIDDFKKKIQNVQKSLDGLSKKMDDIGEGFKDMGDRMAGLSAGAAGIGGAAIKIASDFEGAAGRLQAQMGLTEEEAQELNDVARNVWRQGFGEDVNEAADAVAMLKSQVGDVSAEELEDLTGQAFALAEVFDSDVNEVARTAGVVMKNFGTESDETFDIITRAMQKTGGQNEDLLDTFTEYAPAFNEMGISFEDAAGMIIAGLDAGAFSADKLGDSINEFSIRAQENSEEVNEAFTALGFQGDEMASKFAAGGETANKAFQATLVSLAAIEDDVQRNALGVQLFGTMWEDMSEDAVLAMANGSEALGDFEGAAQDVSDTVQDDFGTRLTSAMRELGEALAPLGEVLIDIIEGVLPYVTEFANSVNEWFQGMGDGSQKLVAALLILTAALAPLLTIVGTLITTFAGVVSIFSKVTGALKVFAPIGQFFIKIWGWIRKAFTAVRIAMLAMNPVVLAIIAVVGILIGIGITLYKNWDKIVKWVSETWNAMWTAATDIFDGIVESISGAMETAVGWVEEKVDEIVGWFEGIDLFEIGGDIIQGLKDGILSAWTNLKNGVTEIGGKLVDAFKDFWDISSPSHVAEEQLGEPFTEGIIRGLLNEADQIDKIINQLTDRMFIDPQPLDLIPTYEATARGYGSGLYRGNTLPTSSTGATGIDQNVLILDVPLIIDGREIARATAEYTEAELERIRTKRQRARGVINR